MSMVTFTAACEVCGSDADWAEQIVDPLKLIYRIDVACPACRNRVEVAPCPAPVTLAW